MENEVHDKFGVASGAQKKAIYATLQALVAHAMTSDPTFSDRLIASVEDYLAPLSVQNRIKISLCGSGPT